jgi:hypothetical protein
VRGRDGEFARVFEEVFRSESLPVVRAPVVAPKTKAHVRAATR